jgi:glutamine synthetase
MFGYSILRSGLNAPFFKALMEQLEAFGTPLEGLHTETGPGTFEAAICPSAGLESADRAVLFKSGVKQIAYAHGMVASFMARWNDSLPGCGGHIHHSLVDAKTGQPCFFNPDRPKEMTPALRHFLAGQLRALPDLLPLYAPTVNSYKRLVEGYWAPTTVTWGHDNRTVCCRVLMGSAKSARIECRVPGADANPYLALAALLASGLYGIEHKLELPEPVSGNAYAQAAPRLSKNLGEATQRFAQSALARELLGAEFVDHFANTRLWEWRQFERAVTDWERKRYFELT